MKHAPREHQRVYLTFYLRVFEGENFIGFLIDLSSDGMMVMSEYPLEESKLYQLRMKLPSSLEWKGESSPDRVIEFSAECLWNRHDNVEKEFYISGFAFRDISTEHNDIIHKLVKEYRIR